MPVVKLHAEETVFFLCDIQTKFRTHVPFPHNAITEKQCTFTDLSICRGRYLRVPRCYRGQQQDDQDRKGAHACRDRLPVRRLPFETKLASRSSRSPWWRLSRTREASHIIYFKHTLVLTTCPNSPRLYRSCYRLDRPRTPASWHLPQDSLLYGNARSPRIPLGTHCHTTNRPIRHRGELVA